MVENRQHNPIKNLYLDTCIYLYAWNNEDPFNRVCYASKQIMAFFHKQLFTPNVSELVVREISKKIRLSYEGTLEKIFTEFKLQKKFDVIRVDNKIKSEAIRLLTEYYLHYPDNFHAGIAKVLNCVLVTKDRLLLSIARMDGIKSVKPEPSFWDKIPGFPYESIIIGLIAVIIIVWRAHKF